MNENKIDKDEKALMRISAFCQNRRNMITSTSNQQIKNLLQLQKKGKVRKEQDVFVVEGVKMYQEAPGERIVKTYVSKTFYEKPENKKLLAGDRLEVVEDRVFDSASDTKTPQGILSIVKQSHYNLGEILTSSATPHLLILENLQDPGNLGTIMRTAEGAGVNGIIMTSDTVDIYNPKTIRSTMGSLYRVPFFYTGNIEEVLKELRKKNIKTYAAHLKGARSYYEEDYSAGTAFLIGNEGNGLSEGLSARSDCYIKIPMSGQVESLNAAIAASILMYEVKRQRRI